MEEPKRLWNRRFVQLLLIEAMLQMGGFLTRPIISNYAIELGAAVPVAGFLAGMLATAALVIRPVSGAISDKLSKKTLLTVSCGLFAAGAFGCALVRSVFWMGVFLALQGFAFAFKSAIIISLVPLVVPKRYTGSGVGWMGLAYTVAIALGPAIGSQVGAAVGYPASFALSGVMLAVALVLAALFKAPPEAAGHDLGGEPTAAPEAAGAATAGDDPLLAGAEAVEVEETALEGGPAAPAPPARRGRFSLRTIFYLPVIPLAVVGGTLMVSQGITSSFILLAGEMRGIEAVSLYFVFYSIANLGARPLAGRASDAWGVRRVAPPMMVVAVLGMLALAFVPSVAGVAAGGVCMGLGQGSAYAAIQAESVRGVPADQLGRSANTYFIGPDLGMGLGPVFGGWVLQSWGPAAMFVFNAATILLALALFLALGPLKRRVKSPLFGNEG
ncbi:MFS transporter [Adlercreutzia faecimuris]|uniref:MFS transporter n=1 Tax=Adlercreutzia faecimuris TaxID=2897341 RepID=A0ABS9WG35_9ACTN|nr:MFS transporter [Adlercreutzia sp. JBNU-10]